MVDRFYERKIVDPETERRRLADKWPTDNSFRILEQEIKAIVGKPLRILDIGSGPNPALGQRLREEGHSYIALDLMYPHVTNQHNNGNNAVQARAEALPFPSQQFDVTHTRAVLAFLPPQVREVALKEILSHSMHSAVFYEYNYSNVDEWTGIAGEFGKALVAVLKKVGFDPYYGREIKKDLTKIVEENGMNVEIIEEPIIRPEGNYYDELQLRASEMMVVARDRLKDEELANTFNNILVQIDSPENRAKLPPFRTPDAAAVVVRFK